MNADWKDMLSALELPEGEQTVAGSGQTAPTGNDRKVKPTVTLFYETKGRAGKPATILAQFAGMTDDEINALASDIKRTLGTGGSCRGGEILLQGDRREQVRKLLQSKGIKVKN